MTCKNKQKQRLMLWLMGFVSMVLASMIFTFYEIHIHQQQMMDRLNVSVKAFMQAYTASDKTQNAQMARMADEQQMLMRNWQQTTKALLAYRQALELSVAENDSPETAPDVEAKTPAASTVLSIEKSKPLSPQR